MLWEKLDKFDIVVQTADSSFQFPRRGDKFLMLVFVYRGHSREALIWLSLVRLHLQMIFLSNILSALELRIDSTVLRHQNPSAKHSTKKWPKEEPTESDFELWQEAVEDIYPSWLRVHSVGKYIAETHRIHAWQWCPYSKNLLHSAAGSATMDVYSNVARKLNCCTKMSTCPQEERRDICSVDKIQPGVFHITSTARKAPTAPIPNSFLAILHEWGCTWQWEYMRVEGGTEWILEAIQDGSLIAVTDGSFIRQLHPNLFSAAFVLECMKRRGKIIRSFSESTLAANVYRGELLGLMAIHLLLVSVNRVHNTLVGSVEVVSDCLGALKRVLHLPPHWIPSCCKHLSILKNILINCRDLIFALYYLHVKAHKDDNVAFDKLSQKLQLNRICNLHLAKQRIS